MGFPTDLTIARGAAQQPMDDIAAGMGIGPHLLEQYGHGVAKIRLEAIDELAGRPKGKYVVVSAITPTPLGADGVDISPATAEQIDGFGYLICGEMRTMPGLGTLPAATRIDIDADGDVVGLS